MGEESGVSPMIVILIFFGHEIITSLSPNVDGCDALLHERDRDEDPVLARECCLARCAALCRYRTAGSESGAGRGRRFQQGTPVRFRYDRLAAGLELMLACLLG